MNSTTSPTTEEPASAAMSGSLPEELLHTLQHSLGVDQYGRGTQFRNHFVTGPGTKDWDHCRLLAEMELMKDHGEHHLCGGGSHLFTVTEEGKSEMMIQSPKPPKPHKLTRSQQRYREYQEAESSMSFREWLGCVK